MHVIKQDIISIVSEITRSHLADDQPFMEVKISPEICILSSGVIEEDDGLRDFWHALLMACICRSLSQDLYVAVDKAI